MTASWQRLDPRMLLVHPVKELVKFLPVLFGLAVAGTASGAGPWALLGVAIPVALGVVRFLTTTYRVSEDRVELRRGLLQRHTLSTPIDRVRTVDLTASPIHRLLGLTTLEIGTGSAATSSDERLELDALPRDQATALRINLLQTATTGGTREAVGTTPGHIPLHEAELVVTRFSPRWLWYAPFSGTVLVAAGAVIGVAAQFVESVRVDISEDDLALVDTTFVALVALGVVLVAAVLAVAGYLVTNGGFVLARQGGTWHVRRGLLTRRETSIDVERLAGVSIGEQALLRLARGRRVNAIVTGLGRAQNGSTVLLPPAPGAVADRVGRAVLATPEPASGRLTRHGRAAATRRITRALVAVSPIVALLVVAVAADAAPGWALLGALVPLAVALALAADRIRSLGHGFLDGHVVTRSGSVTRTRDALAAAHVIGWNLRATWFQRRAGLETVAATTAGGRGRVQVYDVPDRATITLAEAATPGLLGQFLEEPR